MMRRGPLADTPIDALLAAAAEERASGVIELHGSVEALVYLVEGDVYLVDLLSHPPLEEQLLAAGLLNREQIERHTEPGDEGPYLALALDTDATIDEQAIGEWLLDHSATTLANFVGADQGEYELDPYTSHPVGILASWPPEEILDRMRTLHAETERTESERERSDDAETSGDPGDPSDDDDALADDEAVIPLPPPPAAAASSPAERLADPQVLVVTSDTAPDGMNPIALSPVEWRVVVMAARGMSLADLTRRLNLEKNTVESVIASLCDRGLLATVG